MGQWTVGCLGSFNPRPPRGGRLDNLTIIDQAFMFQSTPPAWGATSTTLS